MARTDDRTDPQLKLRIPADLKRKLDAAAEALRRPVGNEIIARLEASFAQDEVAGVPDFTIGERLEALETRVNEIFLDPLMDGLSALKERVAKLERKKKLGDGD